MGNQNPKVLVTKAEILCTEEQKQGWQDAAALDDRDFSPWARRALDKAAAEELAEGKADA